MDTDIDKEIHQIHKITGYGYGIYIYIYIYIYKI